MTEMLEAALAWCRSGFSVIPVGYNKRPKVQWRELQTAPWTEDQVREWWTAHPNDNIGVIPGSNDYAVVDGDLYKEGGGEDLGQFFIDHGLSREGAPMAQTGSGGLHIWFRCVGGVPSGPVSQTIDIKSNGGYVIVPPSANQNGEYKWISDSPIDCPIATDLPVALVTSLRERTVAAQKPIQNQVGSNEVVDISLFRAVDGREKVMADAVWWAGHRMQEQGASLGDEALWADMAWARFEDMAKGRGGVPLEIDHGREELLAKIRSTKPKLQAKFAVPQEAPVEWLPIERWTASESIDDGAFDFVEGLLTDRSISLFYGPSNVGKTFVVFDLAAHVAMGKEWFGREVEGGRAVYVAAEGAGGIRQRRLAFKRYHGAEAADIPLDIITASVSFLKTGEDADIHKLVATIGEARLVVIDTLAAVAAGGDENTSQVMTAVIDCAKKIVAGCGAHVLIVHHQGKNNDTERGHSSLRGAVDTSVQITSSVAKLGRVKVTKQRDLEISPTFGFQLVDVELGVNRRGRKVTSCVVAPTELDGDDLSADERLIKTIAFDIMAGRDPRPIILNFSGGSVPCRDHVLRDEVFRFFSNHANNANRSPKTILNAFGKAWKGLGKNGGKTDFPTGVGTGGKALGNSQLCIDSKHLAIP